ncbi:GntR family transcriptional regulator [Aureimonas endophytica]|uniref:GntR family transcriptional regulator n=1 Tax=Aureimonas endophytica TaxID=2027858 RepID=A0A916ZMN2_9HYPH|nr:GntR family transcriptional regulator [Aureimonas endophytica]
MAERTYVRLRESIINTELPPGTLLKEGELMERLDVGRTPVREALQRLQRDGFVFVSARRGTFVSRINMHDLTAVYEARAKIESWATRLAAERLREPEREEAQRLIAKLRNVTGPLDLKDTLALDRQVHRFIYRAAKNPYLFETLEHYHNLSLRILHVTVRTFPSLLSSLGHVLIEQIQMLEAVCAGDADEAERIALDHVQRFEVEVRKVI